MASKQTTKQADGNMVLRTLYISQELDDEYRAIAFALRTSKNDLIRQVMGDALRGLKERAAISKRPKLQVPEPVSA